ncbi:MAG: H-NS histone family protein [Polyangiaceae bacterium]
MSGASDGGAPLLPDVASLDTATLARLVEAGERELAERLKRERAAFIVNVVERAATLGITPEELPGSFGKGKRKRAPGPPKYRNTDEPYQTWDGQGGAPKWLLAWEAKGRPRKEFLIQ